MPGLRIRNAVARSDPRRSRSRFFRRRYVRMRGVERWYTLQGIRVGRPTAPGIYIRVRGSRAEKRLIR